MSDIDELSQFVGHSEPQQAPGLDELTQFMRDQEAPSIPEQVAQKGKELAAGVGHTLFGPGAQANAKNVINTAAQVAGLHKPFDMPEGSRLAEIEALASGATLGASRLLENKLLHNQAEQAKRQKDNAELSSYAQTAGGLGTIAATGGVGAPLEAIGVGGVAKHALAGAVENSLLTGGEAVSDHALGNSDLNAQKIATDMGHSAMFGAGAGVVTHTLGGMFKKNGTIKGSVAEHIESHQPEATHPKYEPEAPAVQIDKEAAPELYSKHQQAIKDTNLGEIEKTIAEAKARGFTTEMPQKAAVVDAESRLRDLQVPLNRLQVDALDNQEAQKLYGIQKQLRLKSGGTFADLEAVQKAERLAETDKAIQALGGGADVTPDLAEGGQRAINNFSENYQAAREHIAPVLEEIKSLETTSPEAHVEPATEAMAKRVPGVSLMIDESGKIKPYSTAWGIDKSTYEAVAQARKALSEPANIKELMNVRNGLEQNIDTSAAGSAASQIRQLKAGMMDYIQSEIEKVAPRMPANADVARDALRQWAINEQQREVIEKAFGASVGTREFSQIARSSPEKILDKIFSDTAHVKAARAILSPQQFAEIRANYLAAQRKIMTRDGVFSSNKFKTFLDKKRAVLAEAINDPISHRQFQRINDLNTTMRNFPDAAPANNSGTTHGIKALLEAGANGEINIGTITAQAKEMLGKKLTENTTRRQVNKALGATSEKLQKINAVKKVTSKVDEKVNDGIRAILVGGEQLSQKRRKER